MRTNEAAPSASQWFPSLPLSMQLLPATEAWQTPAARPQGVEGAGELADVELGHKAKRQTWSHAKELA